MNPVVGLLLTLGLCVPTPAFAVSLEMAFSIFDVTVPSGNSVEDRKSGEEVIALCDKRIKAEPKDANLYVYRAQAYEKLYLHTAPSPGEAAGYKKAALDSLNAAMSLGLDDHPQFAWRAELRCLGACDGKELEAAVGDLRKAVALHPARGEYKKSLAALLSRQGKGEEAEALSKAAAAPAPKDDLASWVEEMDRQASGLFLHAHFTQLSDRSAAIKELEQSVKICSDVLERVDDHFLKVSWYRMRAQYRNGLGRMFFGAADVARAQETNVLAIGDIDSAIEFAKKGARAVSGWEKRCSGLHGCSPAALLAARGGLRCLSSYACAPEELHAAVEDLKAAIRIDPAFNFELAGLLEKNGDVPGAISYLRAYLVSAKTFEDRDRGARSLNGLERPGADIEAWKPVLASSRVADGVWRAAGLMEEAPLRGLRKAVRETVVFNSNGKPVLGQRVALDPVEKLDTYKFVELESNLTVAQVIEKLGAAIKADDRIMSRLAELGAR